MFLAGNIETQQQNLGHDGAEKTTPPPGSTQAAAVMFLSKVSYTLQACLVSISYFSAYKKNLIQNVQRNFVSLVWIVEGHCKKSYSR